MFVSLREDSKSFFGASLHEVCRTCLGQADENCVSIHEVPDWSGVGGEQIKAILEELTKSKIDNAAPQRICSICFEELQLVRTFLARCIEAENRIRGARLRPQSRRSSAISFNDLPEAVEMVAVKLECDPLSDDDDDDSQFALDNAIGDRLESDSDGVPELEIGVRGEVGRTSAVAEGNTTELTTSVGEGRRGGSKRLARSKNSVRVAKAVKSSNIEKTAEPVKSVSTAKAAKSSKATKTTKPPNPTNQSKAKRRKLDTNAEPAGDVGTRQPQSHLCPACGLSFDNNHEFIKHTKAHAKDNQQFKFTCEFCQKQMRTNQEYKRHRNTHTREQKFICDMCGKNLSNRACLQLHFKYHMNIRKFKCEHCECRFVTSREVKDHTRAKHVVKMIACTYENCTETFDSEHWLNIHLRLHQTNYQFRCDVCGIACVNQYRLKEHKRIHTGETRVPCPFCGKVLSRIQHLRRHIESFHSNNSETATKPSRLLPGMKKEAISNG